MIRLFFKRAAGSLLAALTISVAGCYYDKEEELYPGTGNTGAVTFAGDIMPMISQNCAIGGCHATGGQSPALTTYQLISSNKDKIMARAVNGTPSPMPAAGLMSKTNRDKLAAWISQGAPNN